MIISMHLLRKTISVSDKEHNKKWSHCMNKSKKNKKKDTFFFSSLFLPKCETFITRSVKRYITGHKSWQMSFFHILHHKVLYLADLIYGTAESQFQNKSYQFMKQSL